jgi:hypothetical protein
VPRAPGVLLCAALALAACGPRAEKRAAETAKEQPAYAPLGWRDADGAGAAGIVWRETADAPGLSLTCVGASRQLRVVADVPPAADASARATLQLGPAQFEGAAVRAAGADALAVDLPLTPQLLIALGDAKTARVSWGETVADAGVDEDGKFAALAQRCAALTGVEPAL